VDIEASLSHISNVSVVSIEPSDLLELFSSVWSGNSSVVEVVPVVTTVLDGDNEVSVGPGSDGSGSPVEDPPLFVVVWVVVLDSQSVLARSDVLEVLKSSS